jgi:crossover junction endodeoxyribonuclease RuvC
VRDAGFNHWFLSNKKDLFSDRLLNLGNKIKEVLIKWKPEVVAIEKLFFTVNQKTAMTVAEARGMIIFLCAQQGLTLAEYTPLEIKKCITGYGSADKKQVIEMIPRLIRLEKEIEHDDEYDAIGVALTYLACSTMTSLSTPS